MIHSTYKNSTFLVQDVFTFLAYIQTHTPKIIGVRSLAPRAVGEINSLLCVRDAIKTKHPHTTRGHWQSNAHVKKSERHTTRLRFLHYLVESANLVAVSNARLILTLRASKWLDAPSFNRVKFLFDAAFPTQFTRAQHERWSAYDLPELALKGKLPLAQWLLEILHASSSMGHLKFSTLLKLFRDAQTNGIFPEYENERTSETPEALLRELIEFLEQFDMLVWQNRSIEITELANALLARDANLFLKEQAVMPLAWTRPKSSRVLPDLVADENADQKLLWQLHTYAEHVATLTTTRAHRRLYRLDKERVYQALDAGESVAGILDFLERLTADALPPRVMEWLDEIASGYGKIVLRRAVLLETDEPALLQTVTTHKTIRACIRRTLGPRAVAVKPERVQSLARRLKQQGHQPRIELGSPSQNTSSRDDAIKLFDNRSLGHLYLAAQVVRHISHNARDAYKFPSAILGALQEKVSASDQELAQTMARDLVQAFAEKQNSRSTPHMRNAEREFALATERVPKNLALIQRAIGDNTSLYIRYYSPYRNETTERTIAPLRLESYNNSQYLIAYCHLERDERTFRLDRILEIRSEAQSEYESGIAINR